MLMYVIYVQELEDWRRRIKLCLVSIASRKQGEGMTYIHRCELHVIYCVVVFLLSIQFHASDISIYIVLMSAVRESVNFNWLSLYSDLCILCSDQIAHDYDFFLTCRLYLIYIMIMIMIMIMIIIHESICLTLEASRLTYMIWPLYDTTSL